jgi:hypothetical protein
MCGRRLDWLRSPVGYVMHDVMLSEKWFNVMFTSEVRSQSQPLLGAVCFYSRFHTVVLERR